MNQLSRFSDQWVLMTEYKNAKRILKWVRVDEVSQLRPSDVDLHIDFVFGNIQVRVANGRLLCYEDNLPGVGPIGFALQFALMRRPGQRLEPGHIATITNIPSFRNPNCVSARLRDLRRVLKDNADKPRYLVTSFNPYRLCFDARRSYRVIEFPPIKDGDRYRKSDHTRFHTDDEFGSSQPAA